MATPTDTVPPEEHPHRRVDQLNSLIQQQVAEIIRRELEFPIDTLVTISKARVSDDAESAKLWVSVLPSDQGPGVLETLNRRIGDVQHLLNKRLVMKFVPKIMFTLDTQADKADHINQVLDSIASDDQS